MQSSVDYLVQALLALPPDEREQVFQCVTSACMQVRAVKRRLSGPANWTKLLGASLYDDCGRRVAIVRNIKANRDEIDITTAADTARHFIPGPLRVQIEAEGVVD